MKYLFIISNPSALAISLGIIEKQNLPNNKCLFVLRTNIPRIYQGPISMARFPDYLLNHEPSQLSPFFYLKAKKILRNWFNELQIGKFFLVTPNSCNKVARYLSCSKRCSAFSYMEEGVSSFREDFWESQGANWFRNAAHSYIWPYTIVSPFFLFREGFRELYAVSRQAFGARETIIVEPKWGSMRPKIQIGLEPGVVFVCQTVKWFNAGIQNDYFRMLDNVIETYRNSTVCKYFKLHPEQLNSPEGDFVRLKFLEYGWYEISAELVLETLMVDKSSEWELITLFSSLILYVNDVKKISTLPLFLTNENLGFCLSIPNIYWEFVVNGCEIRRLLNVGVTTECID